MPSAVAKGQYWQARSKRWLEAQHFVVEPLQLSGWNVDMNGAIGANRLGADERYPWNISFWMGGWDGDAMCGYVRGTWTIPTK